MSKIVENKENVVNDTTHSVIVHCCKCGNIETKELKIYEKVAFIDQDCCDKCNDELEYIPSTIWYDSELNAL